MTETDGIPGAWYDVADDMVERGGVAMALGEVDSGKSSFLFWLGRRIARHGRRVWMVDADVGQSDIGPPATIGAAPISTDLPCVEEGLKPPAPLAAVNLYFVGSVSPRRHLLPMVTGTARAVDDALRQGADVVLINTTGYVGEVAAVVMKVAKIDAVRPDVLCVCGAEAPLAAIVDPYRRMRRPRVVKVARSSAVTARSVTVRDAARAANWCAYFSGALVRDVNLDRVGLSGEAREFASQHETSGRVIGLHTPSGACRALGLVVRHRGKQLRILTPLEPDVPVVRIHYGDEHLRLDVESLAEV